MDPRIERQLRLLHLVLAFATGALFASAFIVATALAVRFAGRDLPAAAQLVVICVGTVAGAVVASRLARPLVDLLVASVERAVRDRDDR